MDVNIENYALLVLAKLENREQLYVYGLNDPKYTYIMKFNNNFVYNFKWLGLQYSQNLVNWLDLNEAAFF